MHKPGILLLARADDAGSARAANDAILETVERGIIRNVSVMACGPALEHAAKTLAGLPGICFGLHAVVNAEWDAPRWRPILPPQDIPSLVEPDGAFYPHPALLHERGFAPAELEAEIRAQLAIARAAGFSLGYMDTHMGFDWVHGAREVLVKIAELEGLVLDTSETHPRLPRPESSASIVHRIHLAKPGVNVLITHPGMMGSDMDGFSCLGSPPGLAARERNAERQELCSEEVRRAIEAQGLTLATYR